MNIIQQKITTMARFYVHCKWQGVKILLKNRMSRKTLIKFNSLKFFKHPVYLRRQTSDLPVFEDILIRRSYDIEYDFVPKVIFDCGANIGLASVFYANLFPDAKIIAVEPEASNFELLKKNTESYPNIHLHKNGLWNKKTRLKIEDVGCEKWAFMLTEVSDDIPGSIEAISIPDLMQQYQCDEIDILKIDIEGSEKELFESNYENWLPKVKILIIELHDRMREGAALSFFKAITKYNFNLSMRGENIICRIFH
jgi:FkbM family methyltransferase